MHLKSCDAQLYTVTVLVNQYCERELVWYRLLDY